MSILFKPFFPESSGKSICLSCVKDGPSEKPCFSVIDRALAKKRKACHMKERIGTVLLQGVKWCVTNMFGEWGIHRRKTPTIYTACMLLTQKSMSMAHIETNQQLETCWFRLAKWGISMSNTLVLFQLFCLYELFHDPKGIQGRKLKESWDAGFMLLPQEVLLQRCFQDN